MDIYSIKIRLVAPFFLLIILLNSQSLYGQNNLVKLNDLNSSDLINFNFISGSHNYTDGQIQMGNNSTKNFSQIKSLFNSYIYSLKKEGASKVLSVTKIDGENTSDRKILTLLEEESITIIGKSKGIIITKNSGEDCFGFEVLNNNLSVKMEFPFFSGGFRNPLVASNDELSVLLGQSEDTSLIKLVVFDNNTLSVVTEKEISNLNQMVMDIEITNKGFVLLTNDLNVTETSIFFYDQNFVEINKITSSKRVYNNDLSYDKTSDLLFVQFTEKLYIYNDINSSSAKRIIDVKKLVGEKAFMELELSSTATHDGSVLFFLKPWEQYPSDMPSKILGISKNNNEVLFDSNIKLASESLILVHRTENKIIVLTGDKIELYEY